MWSSSYLVVLPVFVSRSTTFSIEMKLPIISCIKLLEPCMPKSLDDSYSRGFYVCIKPRVFKKSGTVILI